MTCELSISEVVAQLHALGVRPGDVLLTHISFRAVRPIEGGPEGLIAALTHALEPGGTLVMPSWSDDDDHPFDPHESRVAADLGATADIFRRLPDVRRSDHPFAFAARGPKAAEILADGLPLPPHRPESPVGRVFGLDGRVLLIGVDHDANTTLHLAEVLARAPYGISKYTTVLRDGAPVRIDYRETDHCCDRFKLANGWLAEYGLQAEGPVGHALSKLMRARGLVATALPKLAENPYIFLHPPDAGCSDCSEAWRTCHRS